MTATAALALASVLAAGAADRTPVPGAQGAAPDGAGSAPASVAAAAATGSGPSQDAASFVEFVREDDSDCLMREGKHLLVHSTHPARTVRVWLDRYFRNVGTGDRSRSDLKPGAEPEALGCSHIGDGDQEWRIVRAVFVD